MNQEEGVIGKIVGGMICRSVRSRLRNLYWSPPTSQLNPPVIFYANHHGWLDGYLMFHAITKLRVRCLDWIEEFDSFPLFAKVGGMRFAKGDLAGRANTIRRTIKLMKTDSRSLVIFPEGVLHRPNGLLPFGRSLQTIATKVSGVTMVPVAIKYEMSMHERPEAWLSFGESHPFDSLQECETKLQAELKLLNDRILANHDFEVLATGTPSINERMSMKSLRRK